MSVCEVFCVVFGDMVCEDIWKVYNLYNIKIFGKEKKSVIFALVEDLL